MSALAGKVAPVTGAGRGIGRAIAKRLAEDGADAIHIRAVFIAAQAATRRLPEGSRVLGIGSCLAERMAWLGITLYAIY